MSDLIVTLVQADLIWEDKPANLTRLEERILAHENGVHVFVLPEMFSTGFSMRPEVLAEGMDGSTVEWMKRLAHKKKAIITGSLIIEEEGAYFNRLIWMLPTGQYGTYDKRHCFSLAGEDEHYTPGTKRLIASVNGWKVNLCICYDLRFPVWSRQFVEPDQPSPAYDVMIYVANWPDRRISAWNSLLPARAIENQCYVVAVNRVGMDGNGIDHTGYSQVIDPLGQLVCQIKNLESMQTVRLQRAVLEDVRARMPFWKDADSFFIC